MCYVAIEGCGIFFIIIYTEHALCYSCYSIPLSTIIVLFCVILIFPEKYYSGTSKERTICDQAPLFTIQRLFAFRTFLSCYILLPIIVHLFIAVHYCGSIHFFKHTMTLEYKNNFHNQVGLGVIIIKKGS